MSLHYQKLGKEVKIVSVPILDNHTTSTALLVVLIVNVLVQLSQSSLLSAPTTQAGKITSLAVAHCMIFIVYAQPSSISVNASVTSQVAFHKSNIAVVLDGVNTIVSVVPEGV